MTERPPMNIENSPEKDYTGLQYVIDKLHVASPFEREQQSDTQVHLLKEGQKHYELATLRKPEDAELILGDEDDDDSLQKTIKNGNADILGLWDSAYEYAGYSNSELVGLDTNPDENSQSIVVLWNIEIAERAQKTGLSRELLAQALKESHARAQTHGSEIQAIVLEAESGKEKYFNKVLNAKRLYIKVGDIFLQVPYISPPDSAGILEDDPQHSNYHWMMRTTTEKPLSKDLFKKIVRALYSRYADEESNGDPQYLSAIQQRETLLERIIDCGEGTALHLFTEQERLEPQNKNQFIDAKNITEWLRTNGRQDIAEEWSKLS